MSMPGGRWVSTQDWARIVAVAGLAAGAEPREVAAALEGRTGRGAAQAARRRAAAIRACRGCDPSGWRLGADGVPLDPAVRCGHNAADPPVARDPSEPLHEHPNAGAACG
ncbi:hypothetical protein [Mycobacterium kubicae]|nr:hypothetical protein [Mycobacterium kubicae]